jgi:hypothetical protein
MFKYHIKMEAILRIIKYPSLKTNKWNKTKIIRLYTRIFNILNKKNAQSLLLKDNISGNCALDIAFLNHNWIFLKLALDNCNKLSDYMLINTNCYYYWCLQSEDPYASLLSLREYINLQYAQIMKE